MTAPTEETQKSPRVEIIVAIIGLLGILVTAFLSNWDKVFPKQNIVQATYSGYRPTGNFETEFRYYFEVSGTRVMIESMQQQVIQNAKYNLISQYPGEAETINKIFEVAAKESPTLEDMMKDLMPVYQKHFSISEIQELNKFYSTDSMQSMVRKMPLLTHDAAPIQVKILNDYFDRFYNRLNKELKPR